MNKNMMKNYWEMEDEALVLAANAGEETAFHVIFERYKNLVKKKSRSFYLDGGDPEDLIQEGMIGLFKAVRDYDAEKNVSFGFFAKLCIERQISTAIRLASGKNNIPLNQSVPMEHEDERDLQETADSPESILVDMETAEAIWLRLKGSLSRLENNICELLLEGKGYGEIAEILGISKKSVDNGIQRIKRKMKNIKG